MGQPPSLAVARPERAHELIDNKIRAAFDKPLQSAFNVRVLLADLICKIYQGRKDMQSGQEVRYVQQSIEQRMKHWVLHNDAVRYQQVLQNFETYGDQ